MASREQLVHRALNELGIPGAGQQASAEDYKAADDEIPPLMDNLARRRIYTWGDPDYYDDAALIPLAKLLANSIAHQFGGAYDETVKLINEAHLRDIRTITLSGQPQPTEYF